jgi:hypothetical protein
MVLSTLLRTTALLAALLPGVVAATTIGLVTIVDGEVAVLRDTQRFSAAEGLRLRADDIVRTGSQTKLVRLELGDGTTLDLGPATELLLRPTARLGGRASLLYLARGWLKVGAAAGAGEGAGSIAAPQLDVPRVAGTAVLHVAPQAALVFAETGTVDLDDRDRLRDGDAWVRRAGTAGSLLKRPPADLMQGLPRAFVDSLPRRSARFENRNVDPGPAEVVRYAEVAHWLNAEAPLRAAFVPRFAARARDREFRAGLVAELRAHPEWDRTLFPEKYRPKPVVTVRRPAPAASSPAAEPETVLPVAVNLQGPMPWPGAQRTAETNPTAETR